MGRCRFCPIIYGLISACPVPHWRQTTPQNSSYTWHNRDNKPGMHHIFNSIFGFTDKNSTADHWLYVDYFDKQSPTNYRHIWKLGVWWQCRHAGLVELSTVGLVVTWGSIWILVGYWRMWGCNERWWPVSYTNTTCTNKPYIKHYCHSSFECVWYLQISDCLAQIIFHVDQDDKNTKDVLLAKEEYHMRMFATLCPFGLEWQYQLLEHYDFKKFNSLNTPYFSYPQIRQRRSHGHRKCYSQTTLDFDDFSSKIEDLFLTHEHRVLYALLMSVSHQYLKNTLCYFASNGDSCPGHREYTIDKLLETLEIILFNTYIQFNDTVF